MLDAPGRASDGRCASMAYVRQTPAPPRPLHESVTVELDDGATTTVHVARFDRFALRGSRRETRSDAAAARLVYGERGGGRPDRRLLRAGGLQSPSASCASTAGAIDHRPSTLPGRGCGRACTRSAARSAFALASSCPPSPAATCSRPARCCCAAVQSLVEPGSDPEGFSAGSRQFDSDITAGRYPRAALGVGPERADRRGLRGARRGRGGPDARRAGRRDGRARRRSTRSTSTAAARLRW